MTTIPTVLLRAPQQTDLSFYHNYRTDLKIATAEGRLPDPSIQDTQAHLTKIIAGNGHANFSWVIIPENMTTPVGNIAIWDFNNDRTSAELAYGLLPSAQGHGYMSAALSQVKKIAFNRLSLERLNCYTAATNASSRKLLVRNGFKFDEFITEDNLAGIPQKMVIYTMNKLAFNITHRM